MGSGHSASVKSVEEQKPDTGTTLFGSWDNPVADAYALKKQRSKKVMDTAADAAGAAVGSSFQVDAGAGVNPVSTKAPAAKKTLGKVNREVLSVSCKRLLLWYHRGKGCSSQTVDRCRFWQSGCSSQTVDRCRFWQSG